VALSTFRVLAEQGHTDAQNSLGDMYAIGLDVPQDHRRAAKWYRRAAIQGHALAQYSLGVMHMVGKGVRRDKIEAARWIRSATEMGRAINVYSLTLHIGQDVEYESPEAVRRWWRLAANQGHPIAQSFLGSKHLQHGERLDRKNQAAAAKWLRLAAEQNIVDAQYNLGTILANGLGVSPNPVRAYKWYAIAASRAKEGSAPDPVAGSAARARDQLASTMSQEQIANGERLANTWLEKHL
jgi:TPR repeat protein